MIGVIFAITISNRNHVIAKGGFKMRTLKKLLAVPLLLFFLTGQVMAGDTGLMFNISFGTGNTANKNEYALNMVYLDSDIAHQIQIEDTRNRSIQIPLVTSDKAGAFDAIYNLHSTDKEQKLTADDIMIGVMSLGIAVGFFYILLAIDDAVGHDDPYYYTD